MAQLGLIAIQASGQVESQLRSPLVPVDPGTGAYFEAAHARISGSPPEVDRSASSLPARTASIELRAITVPVRNAKSTVNRWRSPLSAPTRCPPVQVSVV